MKKSVRRACKQAEKDLSGEELEDCLEYWSQYKPYLKRQGKAFTEKEIKAYEYQIEELEKTRNLFVKHYLLLVLFCSSFKINANILCTLSSQILLLQEINENLKSIEDAFKDVEDIFEKTQEEEGGKDFKKIFNLAEYSDLQREFTSKMNNFKNIKGFLNLCDKLMDS